MARAGGSACRQRHQGDRRAAQRPPHRPGHRTEDRGHADQAHRRLTLASFGEAGEEAVAGRCGQVRQRGQGMPARPSRRASRTQGRRRRDHIFFFISRAHARSSHRGSRRTALPPYIASKREPDERDLADYQTMFALNEGAVAAPTAGLHFTPALEAALRQHGVGIHRITLHVGPGTFLPVKAADTAAHKMHSERGSLSAETARALNAARAGGRRVVAVGTTSLRLLESATAEDGTLEPFEDETDIFITPGYRFRSVDILLTNFHLPRSTLFMLVSAFSGLDAMKRAYAHAIQGGYRFYSYGDACLLFRA